MFIKNLFTLAVMLFLCQLGKGQDHSNTVPFTLLESGHILIQARINGVEGNFILDTGAGLNVVFKSYANKIKGNPTANFFVGHRATGEALKGYLYQSSNFTLGDKSFSDQLYVPMDMDVDGIDGLISMQPFRNIPLTIDFEKKVVIIGKSSLYKEGSKFIELQIGDLAGRAIDIFTGVILNDTLTVQVLLDSGAGNNSFWFNSDYLKSLGLNENEFKVSLKKSELDPSLTYNFYSGKLASLKTVNSKIGRDDPNVIFVDGLIHEGKTGIDWLGKIITIDIPKRKIFILK